ncbi:patatin-like phospholipase family protein [Rhodoplanes sp. TEM]|uniref:Patatin-like phospholipase family protein n=1 Tax=Rhodoplanes tepidamans TaxID=200616 RepID=A0ABT5JLB5_RHOTP|nr:MULTISPECIES: patatin-like phospholipase family protein [Rhodoplanes]MDC7789994.1 patatin-like phospholipase family protein [Rhodoplanes tepidamans]MDC7983864.1 patatin-like phospholipase family protein [Rhodoplanes sp. TEM]MDQ0354301.1 putative acylesterase/phospholipase RssA [Rhodoplanes tepidamans]
MTPRLQAAGALLALASLAGCASLPREAFTRLEQERAAVAGYGRIREWADASPRVLGSFVAPPGARAGVDVLAISGGGAGGAFTAGLLKGWSRSGRRPAFAIVTGVSTGALIAPFAFLGPDDDGVLERLYRTGVSTSLHSLRNPIDILAGNGLLDPAPLQRLIAENVDADLIARIGAQHRGGRRLFVVTTNLDAQRPVVWDIGAIAASGRPDSVALVRTILLASASIPAVYPPVLIRSRAGEKPIDEMHVDGGAAMQFFLPVDALAESVPKRARTSVRLWVVVNNTLPPEFGMTEHGTIAVGYRSFATLVKSHAEDNARVAFAGAQRHGYDFDLAFIDRQVEFQPDRPFARDYMETVFVIGEQQGLSGAAWRKTVEGIGLAGPDAAPRPETTARAGAAP